MTVRSLQSQHLLAEDVDVICKISKPESFRQIFDNLKSVNPTIKGVIVQTPVPELQLTFLLQSCSNITLKRWKRVFVSPMD